jgi:hypothetical protein
MRRLDKFKQLLKPITNNLERIWNDFSLTFGRTSELFVSIDNRLMANHDFFGIGRIKVFPGNVPNVKSTAPKNRAALLEIVGQSIHRMAVELKSIGEDGDRFHFAVVTPKHEVWLTSNTNALSAS